MLYVYLYYYTRYNGKREIAIHRYWEEDDRI